MSQGIRPARIASRADVDQATIRNLENGRWIRRIEDVIEAYAGELGVDASDLWMDAVKDMRAARQGKAA